MNCKYFAQCRNEARSIIFLSSQNPSLRNLDIEIIICDYCKIDLIKRYGNKVQIVEDFMDTNMIEDWLAARDVINS
jgi:hypothetical protein